MRMSLVAGAVLTVLASPSIAFAASGIIPFRGEVNSTCVITVDSPGDGRGILLVDHGADRIFLGAADRQCSCNFCIQVYDDGRDQRDGYSWSNFDPTFNGPHDG